MRRKLSWIGERIEENHLYTGELRQSSVLLLLESLKNIAHSLVNLNPDLSNLNCINRDKGLDRVNHTDDKLCRQLITTAK